MLTAVVKSIILRVLGGPRILQCRRALIKLSKGADPGGLGGNLPNGVHGPISGAKKLKQNIGH